MPELPEVQTVLNGLSEALRDRSLSALICHYEGTVIIDPEITCSPFPARIMSFRRRGKYIRLDLENEITLLVHLRMTGKLILAKQSDQKCSDEVAEGTRPYEEVSDEVAEGERPYEEVSDEVAAGERPYEDVSDEVAEGTRPFEEVYDQVAVVRHSYEEIPELKHVRASITLDENGLVLFNDPRTFGKIWLCRTENIEYYLPELGLEPLADEFDRHYLGKQVKTRKAPIKNVLLDQKVVAGLGNIYVSEILFRARVRPDRPANSLSSNEIDRIVKETKQVLTEAIALNGTSISDFRRIDDKTGEFQNYLRIYQKDLCPSGHPVTRIRQAGRSSFFCPCCQR